MARSGVQLLIFGSGHDLAVCDIEPHVGLHADSVEPAWDSLSTLPPLMHVRACLRALSLSLKIFLKNS